MKEIEDQLPETGGIGVPQVNRWIRWAGAGEVICAAGRPDVAGGPEAGALDDPGEVRRATRADRDVPVQGTLEEQARRRPRDRTRHGRDRCLCRELEEAIDDEAEFPKPEPKAEPCPVANPSPTPPSPPPLTSKSEAAPSTASNTAVLPALEARVATLEAVCQSLAHCCGLLANALPQHHESDRGKVRELVRTIREGPGRPGVQAPPAAGDPGGSLQT